MNRIIMGGGMSISVAARGMLKLDMEGVEIEY